MTNFQVYRKTLSFSFLMFLVDLVSIGAMVGTCVAGYFIARSTFNRALIGLGIGFVVGIIIAVLISIFITNRIKAAQIAMMTKGVVNDKLPENTFSAGFEAVRGRFAKITAFYFITNAIKGIFQQIGRGVNRIGTAIGGDVGNGVTSAINSGVEILIGYLCDCCLGWILYRDKVNAAKAGCEGAVIFFKHGKTLIRNVGRIFGMGFASLLVIGGAFMGILYLIFLQIPSVFEALAVEIANIGVRYNFEMADFLKDPKILSIFIAGVGALVLWSTIHNVLIRPFILVGVLRNYMAAGIKDIPSEKDFAELESHSPRFAKLRSKA